MACLSQIFRLVQPKRNAFHFVRNITLKMQAESVAKSPALLLNYNHSGAWIWQKNDKLKLSVTTKIQFNLPNNLNWIPPIEDPIESTAIELPTTINNETPKQAERLIVIRRRKMKRHKLKKLRKRMKFEWAKKRQRRELKKEKEFQAVLIKQCKEAEAFSAEKYVEDRLKLFNKEIVLERSFQNNSKNNR